MPTVIAPAVAASATGEIIKTLDEMKAMDAIDKSSAKEKESAFDLLYKLPQDANPFSPTAEETPRDGDVSKNYNAQGSPEVAGNIHAWVSPNKSDEVPSSKESSPEVAPSSKGCSPDSFHLNTTASMDENKENIDNSFSNLKIGTSPISVVGKALKGAKTANIPIPPLGISDATNAKTELTLDASKKDFVKVIHEGKEVLVMLHEDVTDFELCETLIVSLGISQEIVGLKSTGTLLTHDDACFKEHGDIIIPFSAMSSGKLLKTIKSMESVPSFELVLADLDSIYDKKQELLEAVDGSVFSDDSSRGNLGSSAIHESMLFTDAFVDLMTNSKEFDAFEKNALLRFGVDNADSNVLFRAAFRVAVYAENMSYFVKGLKDVASVLVNVSSDEDAMLLMEEGAAKKTAKTIFGLSEFVITADELYECNDLSTGQYVALLDAIFSDDEDIERLFDLYQNPDFLLACETETQRCSLLMRDLLHIGQKLPLINSDDTLLKWAIHTGVHNFATDHEDVPKEFFNIIYHMFSSGDELLLDACKDFVRSNDADVMEKMLGREWSIYCKNNHISPKVESETETLVEGLEEEVDAMDQNATQNENVTVIPEVLSTAITCLEELGDINPSEAAAILTSYSKGNQLVVDVYETYMQDGDTDTFLSMLRVIAPTLEEDDEEDGDSKQLMRDAFKHFVEDDAFRPVDLAALRLASVRKEEALVSALLEFKHDNDVEALKTSLLAVAGKTIAEFS